LQPVDIAALLSVARHDDVAPIIEAMDPKVLGGFVPKLIKDMTDSEFEDNIKTLEDTPVVDEIAHVPDFYTQITELLHANIDLSTFLGHASAAMCQMHLDACRSALLAAATANPEAAGQILGGFVAADPNGIPLIPVESRLLHDTAFEDEVAEMCADGGSEPHMACASLLQLRTGGAVADAHRVPSCLDVYNGEDGSDTCYTRDQSTDSNVQAMIGDGCCVPSEQCQAKPACGAFPVCAEGSFWHDPLEECADLVDISSAQPPPVGVPVAIMNTMILAMLSVAYY